MIGITRGFATLAGAAVAGFLIWLATQTGTATEGEYWAAYGLIAAAGLTMALSQIAGGWTKWGWPRISLGVFVLGFLPVLVVGGWVLLARQPADFFNTSNWSRDFGIDGVVGDLGEALAPIAFLIGLTFGLAFDTAGPRRALAPDEDARLRRRRVPSETAPTAVAPTPAHDGDGAYARRDEIAAAERPTATATDEPLTRERTEVVSEPEERAHGHRRGLRERLRSGRRGDA